MQDRNSYKARSNVIDPLTEMLPQILLTTVLCTFLRIVTPSLGATITQASQLTGLTYDYIIIGGVSPQFAYYSGFNVCNLNTSRDRWTRHRESVNGKWKHYCSSFGGWREVSGSTTAITILLV